MKAKRLVIAGVGVAAILGGTAVVLDQMTAGEPSASHARGTGRQQSAGRRFHRGSGHD